MCPGATCVFYYRITSNLATDMQGETFAYNSTKCLSQSVVHLALLHRTRRTSHSGVFMMSKLDQMLSLLCILTCFMAHISQLEKGRSFTFPWTSSQVQAPPEEQGTV